MVHGKVGGWFGASTRRWAFDWLGQKILAVTRGRRSLWCDADWIDGAPTKQELARGDRWQATPGSRRIELTHQDQTSLLKAPAAQTHKRLWLRSISPPKGRDRDRDCDMTWELEKPVVRREPGISEGGFDDKHEHKHDHSTSITEKKCFGYNSKAAGPG